ncbi:MAG TPA: hypothetical protein VKB93_18715 [Thermoanaerobaculia bacterium]|nr:hypothetical protein [Thermoanaerobaculia bacterium]
MRRATFFSSAALAALLLASCGSMGNGGLGSIGDIILGSPSSTQSSDVQGYVSSVNTQNQSISLDVSYVNNLRPSSTDQRGTIYYDSRTKVVYQGREYRVTDLERGDQISVKGYNDNGRYLAETIEVVRSVS